MNSSLLTVPLVCKNNKNCFVFSTNDAYAPYLGVALYSFLAHTIPTSSYDICILYTDVSLSNRQKILALQRENCNIRFIDISAILLAMDASIFKTHAHFSKEAYYRFFIPQIFINYEKVVYLDCDVVFQGNMQEMLEITLDEKPMGAVLEYKFKCRVEFDAVLRQYALEILQLQDVQKYFNSGVLIFDIVALNNMDFTNKCLEKLIQIQRPRTVDQCVLNSLLQNNIKLIDAQWNLQTHVDVKELKTFVPLRDYVNYIEALLNPKIIHYCSPHKPWNNASIAFGEIWWEYAKKTKFYNDILLVSGITKS